ncbi:MAG: hypothetical protein KDK96_09500 [Chlamydiia bacterium]|nr:hypothetical protein [Chlamydiia bacterium]
MHIPSGFSSVPSIGHLSRQILPHNIKKICAVAFIILTFVCPFISYYAHALVKGKQLKHIPDERIYRKIFLDWHLANYREVCARIVSGKERMLDCLGYRKGHYLDPTSRETVQWKEKSSCLILFVHGLDGHPSHFAEYKKHLERDDRDTHLLTVLNGGHCTTEDGAAPILSLIGKYREKFPQNPIVLIGTSRGGPIMAHIELELREQGEANPRVYVGTIAGANNGAGLMRLGTIFRVAYLFFNPGLIEALDFNQSVPQDLISRQKAGDLSKRQFDYWATSGDFTVTPYSSGFPDIPGAYHFLVHGQGHTSVVVGVREDVTGRVEDFLLQS